MPTHEVKAITVANQFISEIKREIENCETKPKLVGFLANTDPAAKMYVNNSFGLECRRTFLTIDGFSIQLGMLIGLGKAAAQ